jgi:hypothetical protein
MIHGFVHSPRLHMPGLSAGVAVAGLVCFTLVAGLAFWGIGIVLRGEPAGPRSDEAGSPEPKDRAR